MKGKVKANSYLNSHFKVFFDKLLAILGLTFSIPLGLSICIYLFIKHPHKPFYFQKRLGRNGKVFQIIKFRTMIEGAEKIQSKYKKMNEADGPVFKIYNDPRFTKIGRFLAHTGLDELPQLINVIRGEMSVVGPRPLPVSEAKVIPTIYKGRQTVKPGMTSPWVVMGSHKLTFNKWMELDLDYINKASLIYDIKIIIATARLVILSILRVFKKIYPV